MILKKRTSILALLIMVVTGIFLCYYFMFSLKKETSPEENFERYCGSCHLIPNPKNIPKSIWVNNILPDMAARMGYRYNNYDPFKYSLEETFFTKLSNVYPEKPIIDSLNWQKIHDYIINLSPDSIPNNPSRIDRNNKLEQFTSSLKKLDGLKTGAGIVSINFDDQSNQLFIGDVQGNLHDGEKPKQIKKVTNSPIVSSVIDDKALYLTDIGIMNPSQIPAGKIYSVQDGQSRLLFTDLHRPVYSEIVDLNNDGKKEIIVCEFGHHSGQLSLLVKHDSIYKKQTLLGLPGSIKVEVVDMNNDGKKDIVALFSQGREGIYIFYQSENLTFTTKQVIKMGSEYGLSWFSLFDYDSDGDLDLVLVNGDNADISIFLKPYHGVRLFINDGKNNFNEEWFYPINGATRVLAEDFDLDGDHDFAVLSFFPDFDNCLEEGFVYLENQDSENYRFETFTTQDAKQGNWLIMEKGDFDQDGDIDIMLGNFSLLSANKVENINNYDVLYLENILAKGD